MFHCTPCEPTPSMMPPRPASSAPPIHTDEDDAPHVDARRRRDRARRRPRGSRCRAAFAAAPQPDGEQHDETDRHDDVVATASLQRAELDRRLRRVLPVRTRAAAEDHLVQVAQEQREADRHEHARHGSAERRRTIGPPQTELEDAPSSAGRSTPTISRRATSGSCGPLDIVLKNHAISAPKVTSSPCAKFTSPVVP